MKKLTAELVLILMKIHENALLRCYTVDFCERRLTFSTKISKTLQINVWRLGPYIIYSLRWQCVVMIMSCEVNITITRVELWQGSHLSASGCRCPPVPTRSTLVPPTTRSLSLPASAQSRAAHNIITVSRVTCYITVLSPCDITPPYLRVTVTVCSDKSVSSICNTESLPRADGETQNYNPLVNCFNSQQILAIRRHFVCTWYKIIRPGTMKSKW